MYYQISLRPTRLSHMALILFCLWRKKPSTFHFFFIEPQVHKYQLSKQPTCFEI